MTTSQATTTDLAAGACVLRAADARHRRAPAAGGGEREGQARRRPEGAVEARAGEPPEGAPRPRRRDGVIGHELDGEALLYDPVTADTHRLNATAFFIWNACDGRHDRRAIARHIAEHYDVSAAVALEHVEETLRRFEDLNLLGQDRPAGSRA
ncbi:MAG: HPr-rel-A system PqqD family peptide chaperone [Planctomycetes bacterium]|nr:HPr-rel-A system PqqD family peptide chaperone [Planctomycetota bacterium]